MLEVEFQSPCRRIKSGLVPLTVCPFRRRYSLRSKVLFTLCCAAAVALFTVAHYFPELGGGVQKPLRQQHVGLLDRFLNPKSTGLTQGAAGATHFTEGPPHQHVFFLKVHKAASSTVFSVLARFALERRLDVMLPQAALQNILSETSPRWLHHAVKPPPGVQRFHLLFNHLVFNESLVRASLPADARLVAIVREPLAQFASAFQYYRDMFAVNYLKVIPGRDPFGTYFRDPGVWDGVPFPYSFTHNRMSFDFGMNDTGLKGDARVIGDYVGYLNRTFQLVMVSERFDESMVLLKRLLNWRLRDVLYVKSNVFGNNAGPAAKADTRQKYLYGHNFTDEERRKHRAFNAADYALYGHFAALFQRRVEAGGPAFADEVATYRALRGQAEAFCRRADVGGQGHGQQQQRAGVTRDHVGDVTVLAATRWSASFSLSRHDCQLMMSGEQELTLAMRRQQRERWYGNRTTTPMVTQRGKSVHPTHVPAG